MATGPISFVGGVGGIGPQRIGSGKSIPFDTLLLSKPQIKITAFGDSITANGGSPSASGWIINPKAWWDGALRYKNNLFDLAASKGVSGDQTIDLLARMSDVIGNDSDVIMIMIGTNDINQGRTVADIKGSMADIADQIIADGKIVFIVPVLYRDPSQNFNSDIDLINEAYRELAVDRVSMHVCADVSEFNQYIIDGSFATVATDGLHPNYFGSSLIADHAAIELKKVFDVEVGVRLNEESLGFSGSGGLLLNGATGSCPDDWQAHYADPSEGGTYPDRGVGYSILDGALNFKGGTTAATNRALMKKSNFPLVAGNDYCAEIKLSITTGFYSLVKLRVFLQVDGKAGNYQYTVNDITTNLSGQVVIRTPWVTNSSATTAILSIDIAGGLDVISGGVSDPVLLVRDTVV